MATINPFNPNSIVSSTNFAGRVQQIVEICQKLEGLKQSMPSSFFIYGERGIGKTALAKLVRSIATTNDPLFNNLNLVTSYYSVEVGQELNSVLQESLNKLTDEMDRNLIEKIGSRLGKVFQNGKFQIGAFGASVGIDMDQSGKVSDITIKDQTVSILTNIIKELKEGGEKDGVLVIIDELHNLKYLDSAASVFRNIITTLDVEGIGRISFLLIGYEEDIEKFFSQDPSSRRAFDMHRLEVMSDTEAQDVLVKGFKSIGLKWSEASLEKNISAAGGYPHSIQVIGQHLVNVNKDDTVDENDWDNAISDSAIDLRSKSFSTMYSFGKPLTQKDKILIVLAEQNKPLSRKELADLTDNKNIYQYIPSLKSTGAIKEGDDGLIRLHSQLLRAAILIDQYIRDQNKDYAL